MNLRNIASIPLLLLHSENYRKRIKKKILHMTKKTEEDIKPALNTKEVTTDSTMNAITDFAKTQVFSTNSLKNPAREESVGT